MGTKTCDNCGCSIHLNWYWRIAYIFTCFIGPGFMAINYRLIFVRGSFLILMLPFFLQLFLGWRITVRGKYVLKACKEQVKR
jgi:hypothetical protein